MPSQPISSDPLISSFDGTEFFPLVQTATNKRALVGTLWTVNETTIATNTASQAKSQVFNFRTSLWNGSSEVKGWSSWRDDANPAVNLDHSLGLYFSTGASPTIGTPVFTLKPNATITFFSGITHTIGPNAGGGFAGGTNDFGINVSIGTGFGFSQAGTVRLYYSNIGTFTVSGLNITNSTPSGSNMNHIWTATANNDFDFNFTGSFTGRAGQASDTLFAYKFAPTLTFGAAGQTLNAVTINPTFVGASSTKNILLVQNGGTDLFKVQPAWTWTGVYFLHSTTTPDIGIVGGSGNEIAFYNNIAGTTVNSGTKLFGMNDTGNFTYKSLTWNQNGIDAANTATQKSSLEQNFKTSLWNGSSETKGWFSWRVDASTTVAQDFSLALYCSVGASPAFGTPILTIHQNVTITPYVQIGSGVTNARATLIGLSVQTGGGAGAIAIEENTTNSAQGGQIYLRRSRANNATLDAHYIGKIQFESKFDASTFREVAGFRVEAVLDHSASNGGSKMIWTVTKSTTTTLADVMTLTDVGLLVGSSSASQGTLIDVSVAGVVSHKYYTSALNYFSIVANSNTGENRIAGLSGGQYVTIFTGGTLRLTIQDAVTTWADAYNLAFGTGTGTKIGTANNQKIGLWNTTPDVQPTNAIGAAAYVAGAGAGVKVDDTFAGYTLAQIAAALKRLGAIA